MKEAIENIIISLNDALNKNLVEATKDKSVLLLLSGGHDSRVNLSILLKNNIKFTSYTVRKQKGDVEIARKIIKKYGFDYIINNEVITETPPIPDGYDIVVSGNRYTETLNGMHELNRSFDMIVNLVAQTKNTSKIYTPIIEKNALSIVKSIPVVYLGGSIIQKKLICLNEKELLKIPFTYYDWRHYLMNKYYLFIADAIFNSYYTGKGREYVDNKKVKDAWI